MDTINKKHLVIVANGDIRNYAAARDKISGYGYFIACDGGLRHFAPLGIEPDLLIGDFDSAPGDLLAHYRGKGTEMLPFPAEKDETDLALAVGYAVGLQPASVLILGALGGRIDHTLANFQVLAQALFTPIEIWDENTSIQLIHSQINDDTYFTFPREDYRTLSLFPMGTAAAGITTRGLKYPLYNETLSVGETRGVSNEFTCRTAAVAVKSGMLLVIRCK
jgi:thiamine pyrophosphokinase